MENLKDFEVLGMTPKNGKLTAEQIANNENISYWINNSGIGEEFASVSADHNFYWDKNGKLVIVFDKYEVGPGSMGTPEFVIDKGVISDILKPEYKESIS